MKLDRLLPPTWSRAIRSISSGDADALRYAGALETLLADEANDAILILNVPTALASAPAAAQSVVETMRRNLASKPQRKPVFAVWLAENEAISETFRSAGIHFGTEAEAVQGIMHLVHYREAGEPHEGAGQPAPRAGPRCDDSATDRRRALYGIGAGGSTRLRSTPFAGLRHSTSGPGGRSPRPPRKLPPLVQPILARAARCSEILSPDIVHKSDVGGVKLDLTSQEAVRRAAEDIFERTRRPQA